MLRQKRLGWVDELDCDQLVTAIFETGKDLGDQTTLDTVGLDGNERSFGRRHDRWMEECGNEEVETSEEKILSERATSVGQREAGAGAGCGDGRPARRLRCRVEFEQRRQTRDARLAAGWCCGYPALVLPGSLVLLPGYGVTCMSRDRYFCICRLRVTLSSPLFGN